MAPRTWEKKRITNIAFYQEFLVSNLFCNCSSLRVGIEFLLRQGGLGFGDDAGGDHQNLGMNANGLGKEKEINYFET